MKKLKRVMKRSGRKRVDNPASRLAYKLITDGAKVLQFQKFLGGKRQSYETVLQIGNYGGKVKIYHKAAFYFVIEADGWPFIP
ncbi:MAG: hypothetical protein HYT65_01630 [Candidatus Yanofskybacteria bacterium]|nr:hypothetical protein [Candidatus Yanofskybacteria bacterium]